LFAKNPNVYASLGNIIYNNADKISKLKDINEYSSYVSRIDTYTKRVKQLKKLGFIIEKGGVSIGKEKYLDRLRSFSKTNDFFLRSANQYFNDSIENNNIILFTKIINTGLIDLDRNRNKIITYYLSHKKEITLSKAMKIVLNRYKLLKQEKEAQRKIHKTKEQKQKEKILRIRKDDKLKRESLEKALQIDLDIKKAKIINNQKKELKSN